MRRNRSLDHLCAVIEASTIYARTFSRREGQLQQISVFAFSLNLRKHCKLE